MKSNLRVNIDDFMLYQLTYGNGIIVLPSQYLDEINKQIDKYKKTHPLGSYRE